MHLLNKRIAIVGMGATGTAAFIHLVRQLEQRGSSGVTIHTYELNHERGTGLAYSTGESCHRLNMRASTMSVDPDEPLDFIYWLRHRAPEQANSEYVPRRLFGQYLKERLADAERRARWLGIELEHFSAPVAGCRRQGRGLELRVAGGRVEYEQVLLCLGHLPADASHTHERFIANPWDRQSIAAIDKRARVGILGASLTAVDVVLSLQHCGFAGQIDCFTRRRGFPKVQPPPGACQYIHTLRYLTPATLRTLTDDGRRQVELSDVRPFIELELSQAAGGGSLVGRLAGDVRKLNRGEQPSLALDTQDAERGFTEWYAVLDAIGQISPLVWRHLSDAAKHRFLSEYEAYWAMIRHCMPLVNAQQLRPLAELGRLRVYAKTADFEFQAARDQFRIRCTPNGHLEEHWVDYLVDARGTRFAVEQLQSSILRSCLEGGLLAPHAFGGVHVDFDTCAAVDAAGVVSERLFFVGPLTRGVHFYTNSFETNRNNAFAAINAMLGGPVQTLVPRAASAGLHAGV